MSKKKGSNAERELIHLFWTVEGWAAARVAGSGSIKYPAPDIIAGNKEKLFLIEAKISASDAIYLTHIEVAALDEFSRRLNGIPLIAWRFDQDKEWAFIETDDLRMTGKHFVITENTKGKTFKEITM